MTGQPSYFNRSYKASSFICPILKSNHAPASQHEDMLVSACLGMGVNGSALSSATTVYQSNTRTTALHSPTKLARLDITVLERCSLSLETRHAFQDRFSSRLGPPGNRSLPLLVKDKPQPDLLQALATGRELIAIVPRSVLGAYAPAKLQPCDSVFFRLVFHGLSFHTSACPCSIICDDYR